MTRDTRMALFLMGELVDALCGNAPDFFFGWLDQLKPQKKWAPVCRNTQYECALIDEIPYSPHHGSKEDLCRWRFF